MDEIRIVTKIEELDKRRSKVYINQEFAFVLYKGEIVRYRLKNEKAIEDSTYQTIRIEVLPKRAKKRCLNLLQKKPYTEYKLREKLMEGFYTQDVIDDAINYVKSFHYVDDYDYACQYIFYHKERESRRKMEEKLIQKGISKDVLKQAFEDSYEEGEQQENEFLQARKLLEKKKYNTESADWKERQKIYALLVRKGIGNSVIRQVMEMEQWEDV